jgi:flagellin-like hook-associated protein FlgL
VVRETVTSDMTRRRLVAQRESGMRALQNALAGIGKLSAAESAFALGKSLVEQARELASTANDVGADRAAIASEVNGLLAQAKDVVKGATYEGKRLFSGVAAEIRVPTGGGSGRSFGVKLSGKQTFTLTDTSQPVKEWTQLLGGTGDESVVGRGIGVDGGLYLTGTTRSTQLDGKTVNGLRDSYIIKVNPDGSKAWTQLVGGAGGDDGDSLVFDPSGSVFIAGVTDSAEVDGQTSNGGVDVFISKFNADGTKAWTQLFGGTGDEGAVQMGSGDGNGNLYVVATSSSPQIDGQTTGGAVDVVISKYDASGARIWTRVVGGASNEVFQGFEFDTAGNIYVSGHTSSEQLDGQTVIPGGDAFITKFSSDGTKQWTQLMEVGGSIGRPTVSSSGDIYISGVTTSATLDGQANNGGQDFFIRKYNSDGTKNWTRVGGGSGTDYIRAASIGADGSLYLSGTTDSTALNGQTTSGGYDAFLLKMSQNGTNAWTKIVGGTGEETGIRRATVSVDGGIYLFGSTTSQELGGQTNTSGQSGFITRFNPDGSRAWTRLGGGGGSYQSPVVILSDTSLYLTGESGSPSLEGKTNNGGLDAYITRLLPHTVTQTTKTAPFSGLTVDLSTQQSVIDSLANIDSALSYFMTTARSVRSGLSRVERAASYLSNSVDLIDDRLSRYG